MGDVAILLHSDDLQEHIPEDTHRIFISAVKQSLDTSSIFLRSTVKKRWPTQKTRNGSLIKVVVEDGEHDTDAINCFFVGDLADQSDIIAVGDTLLLNKFYIENSTNPASSSHSCQLLLDKRRSSPVIVILHNHPQQQQQEQPTNTSPKVAACTSRQNAHASPKRPPKNTAAAAASASTSVPSTSDAPTGRTAVRGQGPKVTTNYTYTKLGNLVSGTVVNVYGIVKFVKQPFRTRGTDYMMLVSIVDSSLDSLSHKLKCILFAREQNAFPAQAEVGDIIRMHRLKISEFNGELQGKNGPAFSFLLFDNGTSASLTPKFKSTNHYTITEEDYNRVTELRTWWSSLQLQDPEEETPLPRSLALSDVQCGSYFDLTCQVVAVCPMTPREGCLLKVWDGTKASVPVYGVDSGDNDVRSEAGLARKVADFIVDVCVFDNHFERGSYCQPGNYVKFYNLHAMKHKSAEGEQHSAVSTVELCLHGGTSYGRGMRIFDETDQQIQSIKKKLEDVKKTLPVSPAPSRPTSPQTRANQCTPQRVTRSSLAPLGETTNQEVRRSPRIKGKTSPQRSSRKRALEASPSTSAKRRSTENGDSADTPRCMVNTATVIIGHRHIPQTSIRDVQNHSVPYKFRVQARLMDYQPKVGTARDLLKLYCPKCHYLSHLPESKAAMESPNSWAAQCSSDTVEDGIPMFQCPACSKHRQHKSTVESQMLKYIYMFQLILYDESGWIVAQLMKDEAVVFFDTPTSELIRKRQTFQWLQAQLRELCPSRSRDKTRPLMELCIKSYSTPSVAMGTSYQIFDTSLALQQDSG